MKRRNLLAATPAVVALTGAAAATPTPALPTSDAELLALCAEFQRLHAEGAVVGNPDWEKADAAAWDVFNQLNDMTPASEAGHRAKAGVAIKMLSMFHEGKHGGDPEAVFALHMLRDWLGRTSA